MKPAGSPRSRRAIFLPGKLPRPGQTKTRLSPPLSLEQAALVYHGFLRDSVALALSLGWDRVTLAHPEQGEAAQALAALLPPQVQLLSGPGSGLGDMLQAGFARALADGYGRVVMFGSDNPTLPPAIVEMASRGLDDHDLVIGPCSDGGYYLLGMTRLHPGLFQGISWSTDVVYAQTLERARDLGLSLLALPEWYDVDTAHELRRLQGELANLPADVAPATRSVLAGLTW